MKCSVCGRHTTRCCSICSNGDKMFALCDPATRPCLLTHRADPTCPSHTLRVSTGKMIPRKKRQAPSQPEASCRCRPAKTPHHGTGSQSSATPNWDKTPAGATRWFLAAVGRSEAFLPMTHEKPTRALHHVSQCAHDSRHKPIRVKYELRCGRRAIVRQPVGARYARCDSTQMHIVSIGHRLSHIDVVGEQ